MRQNVPYEADGRREAEERVLTAATVRAATHLGLKDSVLATIIGVSASSVSRMRRDETRLHRDHKSFELAQLFLRMFRSLDALAGSEDAVARSWLTSHNLALRARPIDLIQTIRGLMETVTYVDSRRAIV
jgi:hypothetical protein